jgi:hypothetical protein
VSEITHPAGKEGVPLDVAPYGNWTFSFEMVIIASGVHRVINKEMK